MQTQEKTETSTSDYVEAWQSHVNTLDRLRWNLTQSEQEKLDKIQEGLKDLIACAVEDLIKRRQVKEDMQDAGVEEDGE